MSHWFLYPEIPKMAKKLPNNLHGWASKKSQSLFQGRKFTNSLPQFPSQKSSQT